MSEQQISWNSSLAFSKLSNFGILNWMSLLTDMFSIFLRDSPCVTMKNAKVTLPRQNTSPSMQHLGPIFGLCLRVQCCLQRSQMCVRRFNDCDGKKSAINWPDSFMFSQVCWNLRRAFPYVWRQNWIEILQMAKDLWFNSYKTWCFPQMSTMDSPKATIKLGEQPTPLGLIELLWKGITTPGSPGEDIASCIGIWSQWSACFGRKERTSVSITLCLAPQTLQTPDSFMMPSVDVWAVNVLESDVQN